jgi:hypothetical protein
MPKLLLHNPGFNEYWVPFGDTAFAVDGLFEICIFVVELPGNKYIDLCGSAEFGEFIFAISSVRTVRSIDSLDAELGEVGLCNVT